ncbi:hypothetical protein AWW67_07735 [Roseivirga seohaensis]|uniref:CD-NTase-associated protein 15 domain-containing protein n=1 Tax=Roseivirga seohaensis TaxID=1914963 RepID=A0A150XR65_9BACT|nr:hypothetical protein [Roseivirga seohaensis]KYG81239.1 hypothetical protein AWW67_07735 [Roseivirga seohaensis]
MNNGYFKYYKSGVLVTLLAILAVVLYLAKDYWGLSISIVSVITGLLYVIDKWLWNTKFFSWMFWVDDFSGRYEGQLEYEFRDENCQVKKGVLKHVKIIHQTGSKISVVSFTIKTDGSPSSLSESQGMYVEKTNGDKHFNLIYSYLNQGSQEQGFPPHYGTEIIKVIGTNDKVLSGRYFTERLPYSTKGKFIDLKWVSKNEQHDF